MYVPLAITQTERCYIRGISSRWMP